MKNAKYDWIGAQCEEIETCLDKNNSKRAYQLVKDLTSEEQMDKILQELYNHESCGDNAVLVLCEEVEIAVKSLKKGKSVGVDNIPAELV